MRYRMSWLGLAVAAPLVLVAAGCAPQPVYIPTPTKTPDPAFALVLSEGTSALPPSVIQPPAAGPTTPAPEVPPSVTSPPEPSSTIAPAPLDGLTAVPPIRSETPPDAPTDPIPEASAVLMTDHYWMQRPIPGQFQDYLDRTYPYGGTAGGRLRPHTGVEFFNPAGTPVLAVANASVYYAGTDAETLFGPQPNFYGNLIVLELTDYSYSGQPIYALYGHLSAIDVQAGQAVAAGDRIGAVGGTGVANGGSHLHFEVRIGDPMGYFTSTRNPDLWIKPYGGYGTLAGRILSADGVLLREVSVNIRGEDMPRYTWTYAGDENIPDGEARENFTYGDLPEGWYTVSANSGRRIYQQRVYIQAGRTSLVEIVFDE